MIPIELIFCWEDGTWTTEVHQVPEYSVELGEVEGWARRELLSCSQYRKAVYVGLYCIEPEGPEG